MDKPFSLCVPLHLVERITYYSLELRPERCPSWDLHYAFEHHEVTLSPALRACDWRNGKAVMLLDKHLVEELASYAEPIMQRRYGPATEVHVVRVECPKNAVKQTVFDTHHDKVVALLQKLEAGKAVRSVTSKVLDLPKAELIQFPSLS
ncbi:hypothetical protein [Pseudomonas aeruginosa]|uniref:hypothetical protein n=1 Tax=Pseudomonas aeruginosa TaxID=287 RepID=UPI001BC974CB|nr:hypothetical protein [Pseudomonas aeruginosa]HED8873771.1 hypothetical protein [Pseudomonas aeruginosa]